MALAQLADALTFTVGVSRFGIGIESNGVAAWLYQAGGLDAVLLDQGHRAGHDDRPAGVNGPRFPRLFVWGGTAATSLGLLGFTANSLSILLLS